MHSRTAFAGTLRSDEFCSSALSIRQRFFSELEDSNPKVLKKSTYLTKFRGRIGGVDFLWRLTKNSFVKNHFRQYFLLFKKICGIVEMYVSK